MSLQRGVKDPSRAMPEIEKPPARLVDIYFLRIPLFLIIFAFGFLYNLYILE